MTKTNGKIQNTNKQVVELDPFRKEFQRVKLEIGTDWEEGLYNLTLVGKEQLSGINESFPIEYIYKRFIIMVQTDKAIYRPGDDVKIRILILNDELKAVDVKEISDMKIYIMVISKSNSYSY